VARILVVDDEPDIRFLLRLIFEGAGHIVAEARDGAAGGASVKIARPDLIITDMMMPMMGGQEFITGLRSHPETATIPILAVSGNPELASAADAVLSKPFLPKELLIMAAQLIGKNGR